MTDVFISYKRENELRVAGLVQALERAGFKVWWDRGLVGGEPWRESIDQALMAAKVAVVVWTRESTGPAGGFVRDEASRAARRGVLIPVLLDPVDPPLGFGEVQAIDLVGWKGSPRDPFFQDLVAVLRARLEGRPAPSPQGPLRRLKRRLGWATAMSMLTALATGFATDVMGLQQRACAAPVAQPTLSDACGALGLGGRPGRAERESWQAREPGSCEALRAHLRRFPDGALRATAGAALAARQIERREVWTPAQRPLRLLVGRDVVATAAEPAARADAVQRGLTKARALCADFAAAGATRVLGARVEPQEWLCERRPQGVACGFEGRALCMLEEASTIDTERCDGPDVR